jgi:GNAT superfamily N-acetyltransferase
MASAAPEVHEIVAGCECQTELRVACMEDIPALQRLIATSARLLSIGYYTPQQIDAAVTHIFGVDSALIHDKSYFLVERKVASASASSPFTTRPGLEVVACGGWSRRKTLFGSDGAKQLLGSDSSHSFVATSSDPLHDVYLNSSHDPARIRAFFVHPMWARRGLARQIFEACEQRAKEAGFARLEMMATLPGVPLYVSLGCAPLETEDTLIKTPSGDVPCRRMGKCLL